MAIALTLKEYLEARDIHYEIIDHVRTGSTLQTCEAAHVPGDRMAKSVLLGDDQSYLMAVIPATHRLLLERLNALTGRQLELVEEIELVEAFADCEPGALPPIGRAYGIETLVDHHLLELPEVYLETGDHTKVLHVTGEQFQRLADEAVLEEISRHL